MSTRNKYLIKKYGITETDYEAILQEQDGRCAVCLRHANEFKVRLAVDHDHKTGRIRGLLCNYCNRRIIGRHRRELGADLLRRGHDYLIREYYEFTAPPRVKRRKRKKK